MRKWRVVVSHLRRKYHLKQQQQHKKKRGGKKLSIFVERTANACVRYRWGPQRIGKRRLPPPCFSLSIFFYFICVSPLLFPGCRFCFLSRRRPFSLFKPVDRKPKNNKKLAGASDELRKQNNKTVRTYTSINACWEIKKQKGWNDYETLIIYLQFDKRRVKDNASAPYWYYIVFLFVSVWKKKKEKKKIDYSTKRPYGL